MTKTLYAATSKYVAEINNLPVKRQVSVLTSNYRYS